MQRVADQFRQRHAPGEELFVLVGVPGDQPLRHAANPHGAVLVGVGGDPKFGEIPVPAVRLQVLDRQVVVPVDHRQRFHSAVKPAGDLRGEKKIVVHIFILY